MRIWNAVSRCTKGARPKRACVGPPVQLFLLRNLSQSWKSNEGEGLSWLAVGLEGSKHPCPDCAAGQKTSPTQPPLWPLLPMPASPHGLWNESALKHRVFFFFSSLNLSPFCPTRTGTEQLKSWQIQRLICIEGKAICFWMERRILGESFVPVYNEAKLHVYLRKRN